MTAMTAMADGDHDDDDDDDSGYDDVATVDNDYYCYYDDCHDDGDTDYNDE